MSFIQWSSLIRLIEFYSLVTVFMKLMKTHIVDWFMLNNSYLQILNFSLVAFLIPCAVFIKNFTFTLKPQKYIFLIDLGLRESTITFFLKTNFFFREHSHTWSNDKEIYPNQRFLLSLESNGQNSNSALPFVCSRTWAS